MVVRTAWVGLAAFGLTACGGKEEVVDTAPETDEPRLRDPAVVVDKVAVGEPWWEPTGFVAFVADPSTPAPGATGTGGESPDDGSGVAACLLPTTQHVFDPSYPAWIPAGLKAGHPGPYGNELIDGVATCGWSSTRLFEQDAFQEPNAVFFGFVLAPNAEAPEGRTIDAELGPIIPSAFLPITYTWNLLQDEVLIAFEDDGTFPSIEDMGIPAEGSSHLPVLFWQSTRRQPPGTVSGGVYRWEFTLTDQRGNGWTMNTVFYVGEELWGGPDLGGTGTTGTTTTTPPTE